MSVYMAVYSLLPEVRPPLSRDAQN